MSLTINAGLLGIKGFTGTDGISTIVNYFLEIIFKHLKAKVVLKEPVPGDLEVRILRVERGNTTEKTNERTAEKQRSKHPLISFE